MSDGRDGFRTPFGLVGVSFYDKMGTFVPFYKNLQRVHVSPAQCEHGITGYFFENRMIVG